MVVAADVVALRSSHPERVDVAARRAESAVVKLEEVLARLSARPCPPVLGRAADCRARVHELATSAVALIAMTAWPLTDAYCATALLWVPCPLRVGEEMYRSGRVALAAEKRVEPKLRRGHSSLEHTVHTALIAWIPGPTALVRSRALSRFSGHRSHPPVAPARWTSRVLLPQNFEGYVSKFTHKALKSTI